MDKVLILIIVLLIIVNIVLFIYGKRKLNEIKKNENAKDEDYKKGMKYIILSSAVSFLTIILIIIMAIIKLVYK